MVKEDGIHSLIISPVRPDDTGEYTVRAESRAGKEECDMDLTVLGKHCLYLELVYLNQRLKNIVLNDEKKFAFLM